MAKKTKLLPVTFVWKGEALPQGEKFPEELQEQIRTAAGKAMSDYYGRHVEELNETRKQRAALLAAGKYPPREAIGRERMDAIADEMHRLAAECGYDI